MSEIRLETRTVPERGITLRGNVNPRWRGRALDELRRRKLVIAAKPRGNDMETYATTMLCVPVDSGFYAAEVMAGNQPVIADVWIPLNDLVQWYEEYDCEWQTALPPEARAVLEELGYIERDAPTEKYKDLVKDMYRQLEAIKT